MAGRKSLFKPVADKLLLQIANGHLLPGDMLPSEHELCRHYSLSRSSIRKALEILEQKGAICRQPGVGTFVSPRSVPERGKKITIGIPDLPSFSYAYPAIFGMREACAEFGAELAFFDFKLLTSGERYPYDALLYIPVGPYDFQVKLPLLEQNGVPVCILNRIVEGISSFYVDYYKQSKAAVRLLYKLGMKSILAIEGEEFGRYSNQQRIRGYKDAVKEAGGNAVTFASAYKNLSVIDKIAEVLEQKNPDSLFLPHIGVLDWVLYACKQANREPGKDIVIFCFDRLDSEIYSESGIIYADMPMEKMASEIIRHLYARVKNQKLPLVHKVFNVKFVIHSQLLI